MSSWYFIETSNGLVLKLTEEGIILCPRSQVGFKLITCRISLIVHIIVVSVERVYLKNYHNFEATTRLFHRMDRVKIVFYVCGCNSNTIFLSDPGKPRVQSLGPDVRQ